MSARDQRDSAFFQVIAPGFITMPCRTGRRWSRSSTAIATGTRRSCVRRPRPLIASSPRITARRRWRRSSSDSASFLVEPLGFAPSNAFLRHPCRTPRRIHRRAFTGGVRHLGPESMRELTDGEIDGRRPRRLSNPRSGADRQPVLAARHHSRHFTEHPRARVSAVAGSPPSSTASSASRSQRALSDGSWWSASGAPR